MRFWRISNYADLSGIGGNSRASRWNRMGRPVVYLADHPSTALLEILVSIDADEAPPTYQLLLVEAPESVLIKTLGLPDQWQQKQDMTRHIGSTFLQENEFPLLRVPSVVMPQAFNYLLNPAHPEAASFKIEETWRYPFDSRLLS